MYAKGCVATIKEGLIAAEKIGYPVIINTIEGNGENGKREVESKEHFSNAFRQVFKTNHIIFVVF